MRAGEGLGRDGRRERRARFLGREEGPRAREKGTHWEQSGQRREAAAADAEAGGREEMQEPHREWPHGRTRGTTETASKGERQTGHSGGSASDGEGDAAFAMAVASARISTATGGRGVYRAGACRDGGVAGRRLGIGRYECSLLGRTWQQPIVWSVQLKCEEPRQ